MDRDHRLTGSVRLHALILADDDTPVEGLMESALISVTLDTDQEDVGKRIACYDLLAIPVVGSDGRLMGGVTHDDAADEMQAEATEDFQKIPTVLRFTQNMRQAGIACFEGMILPGVSLVFFLPLLIESSGDAGSQSAVLMVRALATGVWS